MYRTATHDGWRLYFSSDLSGVAILYREDGDLSVRVGLMKTVLRAECPTDACQVEFPTELLHEVAALALEGAADDAQAIFDKLVDEPTLEQACEDAAAVVDLLRGRAADLRTR